MRYDLHQHLWTAPLVDALRRRDALPFARRAGADTVLMLPGESPAAIDAAPESVERRLRTATSDGVDRILVALSSPVGIESLPRREAEPLLDAWEEGLSSLPPVFGAWGALALRGAAPARGRRRCSTAASPASRMPAGAIATPTGLGMLLPVLRRLEERGAPLFVHPGPSPWRPPARARVRDARMVAGADAVRRRHAGGVAFLHDRRPAASSPSCRSCSRCSRAARRCTAERLAARGGPANRGIDSSDVLRHLLVWPGRRRRDGPLRRRRAARARLGPPGRRAPLQPIRRGARPCAAGHQPGARAARGRVEEAVAA